MPHTAPSILTEEYLNNLPLDRLINLLLHKTNLITITVNNHITDVAYLDELKEDVKKIHAAMKLKTGNEENEKVN